MPRSSAPRLSETFGLQVRAARRQRDWSQQDLAERIGKVLGDSADRPSMKQANIAKIEAGQRKRLVVEDVLLFAAALNVSPVHLLVPFEDDHHIDTGFGAMESAALREWVRGWGPPPHAQSGHEVEWFWSQFRPPNDADPRLTEEDQRRLDEVIGKISAFEQSTRRWEQDSEHLQQQIEVANARMQQLEKRMLLATSSESSKKRGDN